MLLVGHERSRFADHPKAWRVEVVTDGRAVRSGLNGSYGRGDEEVGVSEMTREITPEFTGKLRVFVYQDTAWRCAVVQEVDIDIATEAIVEELRTKVLDARFSYEDNVTSDEPEFAGKRFTHFQLEGTVDCDGVPTFHELCIDSEPEGTSLDRFDWRTFCEDCLRYVDHMADYEQRRASRKRSARP